MHAEINWTLFIELLLTCFGPNEFKDFVGALTKLHQTNMVRDYVAAFEKLTNYPIDLPDAFFKVIR